MTFKYSNNASATLALGIGPTDTSIPLTSGQGAKFPSPGPGESFRATLIDALGNVEIIDVTARSTDTLTVTRAQEGTSGRTFSAGDRVELRLTKSVMENLPQLDTANTFTQPQTLPGAPSANNHAATKKYVDDAATAATSSAVSTVNGQIGVTIQAHDPDTAKTDVAQTFTASQKSGKVTDNDLSFDLSGAGNNYFCTPTAGGTLTFTNIAANDGKSGYITLVNGSKYAIAAAANTKITAADLAKISATGRYVLPYLCDGTDVDILGVWTRP